MTGAAARYDELVARAAGSGAVWCLASGDEWTLWGDDDGADLLPVWPDAPSAAACGDDDEEPEPIALAELLDDVLPRLTDQGLLVAVSPDTEGEALLVRPQDLADDLRAALSAP